MLLDVQPRAAAVSGPLRVLLVDDDVADRTLLRRAIERSGLGATLEEVGTVSAALARVADGPMLDCVVTDLHLPDGGPAPLLNDPARRFAVIVVTGLDAAAVAQSPRPDGADDYLSKDDASAVVLGARMRAAMALRQACDRGENEDE